MPGSVRLHLCVTSQADLPDLPRASTAPQPGKRGCRGEGGRLQPTGARHVLYPCGYPIVA